MDKPPLASSASANPPAMPQAPTAITAPTLGSTVPAATAAAAPAVPASSTADAYDQAASNLVAGKNLEQSIQQILDIGGGTWDRDTVVRALRAAFNNPERAVEYLYSGIPEQAEVPPVAGSPSGGQTTINPPPTQDAQAAQPTIPSSGPNANPLDLFPQGLPSMGTNPGAGNLDFLRNSPQVVVSEHYKLWCKQIPKFCGFYSYLYYKFLFFIPFILLRFFSSCSQPMLLELSRQNPQIARLIQEHQSEFLSLINEPAEGEENNLLGQLAASMPQALTVTPEERDAIERLEAMGFNRALVLEVFFACNKNEDLAANYLLDHMHEFED
ncbi:hypothetical protein M5K25_012408 [Dendrobium thyrsiflorum]|uniref:Ubiquitin receptor RAD23 n=1 Tax=Dendrobium thyrsiflorum TaxID=117978 RepID=A0ABD0UXG0_DENTH